MGTNEFAQVLVLAFELGLPLFDGRHLFGFEVGHVVGEILLLELACAERARQSSMHCVSQGVKGRRAGRQAGRYAPVAKEREASRPAKKE